MYDTTPTVLVVDPEPSNRGLLTDELSSVGYEAVTASDGLDAWKLLSANPERFDAVLLDRASPGLDGIGILQRMRHHDVLDMVPAILQTPRSSTNDIIAGIRAGAYYCLAKPVDADTMLAIVNAAVTDFRGYRSAREQIRDSSHHQCTTGRGSFHFRTPQEARSLAALLANSAPDPDRVVGGLTALMVNAIEHGNLDIGYATKSRLNEQGLWQVEVERRLKAPQFRDRIATARIERVPGELRYVISDAGAGFDPRPYLELTTDRAFDTHGRGIALAKRVSFDRIEYRGAGNEVVAALRIQNTH